MREDFITMAHGSGGAETASLVQSVFAKHFKNEILDRLEDSAVVALGEQEGAPASLRGSGEPEAIRLAVSTDSYVVTPLVFPGGDIGKLAVCGTVNDVLMSGAAPHWLTCGFIIEAGLQLSLLDEICGSMAAAAAEAGVTIIAGDTKVIEGHADHSGGLIINTTGIGVVQESNIAVLPGDAIIVSGNLGDHHAAILSSRMGIKNKIKSDCALLAPIITALQEAGVSIHAMRDVTRGGLGTILNELAAASQVVIELEEERIPVDPEIRAFCGLMGLDPVYMGNEGKMVLSVAPEEAERAVALIRGTEIGKNANMIGYATGTPIDTNASALVTMRTRIGGTVRIDVLYGEGLPRIC